MAKCTYRGITHRDEEVQEALGEELVVEQRVLALAHERVDKLCEVVTQLAIVMPRGDQRIEQLAA